MRQYLAGMVFLQPVNARILQVPVIRISHRAVILGAVNEVLSRSLISVLGRYRRTVGRRPCPVRWRR